MAHTCSWWQTHGLHRDEEDNLAEQLGLVGLIGQRSYCGLTPQPSLPVDVDATADPGPGGLSTSNHSAAVNMQNLTAARSIGCIGLQSSGGCAFNQGPYFVVWYVQGARMECRGVHGRGSRAWLAICRATPGGRPRHGCDLIRGGFATRAEAREAYLRDAHMHNCPPGCAEWRW